MMTKHLLHRLAFCDGASISKCCIWLLVNGVAPRAKMNQQHSIRFRAAPKMPHMQYAAEEERLRVEFEREGRKLPSKLNFLDMKPRASETS
ncbi:putative 5-3 exonuclease, 5'-3' exoribonuclease [Helianthus annuus]|nr:putative 5-3 exonuclease, 5'-3' exoribonuclease [Helianthus annuus]